MGWKAYYKVDETYFKDLYEKAERWGNMDSYMFTVQGEEHYGAGKVGTNPTTWIQSPKIQHYTGKTRIRIKYYLWANAGATGKASIGIVFYKNDESSKDELGYDLHGATHTISEAPSVNTGEPHEMVVEQENNRITWSVDGEKLGEATLEAPLTSFKLAVAIDEVSGDQIGIIITEVTAEYYDFIEDMVNQLMSVMNILVWVFLGVSIILMIVKAFKPTKKAAPA